MAKYDPERHHRRSVRFQGYDYTQNGAYFVTMCIHNRECLFGEIRDDGIMRLNECGEIVQDEWLRTEIIRREVELDVFLVMPNHFHAIVVIMGDVGTDKQDRAHSRAPLQTPSSATLYRPPKSLGSLIAGFKAAVTKGINVLRDTPGAPVWQRSYFDRIIRDEKSLNLARQYIENNPAKWADDRENPVNVN